MEWFERLDALIDIFQNHQPKHRMRFLVFSLVAMTSSANVGWYEVKNYAGTIGKSKIHISLQTYDHVNHREQAAWRVDGSYYYYYDYRLVIPLQGQRQQNGDMVLCEASRPRSPADSPTVAKASPSRPVPCPMSLTFQGDAATGAWSDGKKNLPIVLRQVGRFDDTNVLALEGVVEIPMWYHTKKHMLLGVYQAWPDCPVSMSQLRLVNIRTGQIDRMLEFDCQAGMIMTSIYANVSAGPTARQITVGFQGGKMGYDEVFDLEPKPRK